MSKARPKRNTMFHVGNFTGEAKCYIHCYPQQKWNYWIKDNRAIIEYKNISLEIPRVEFEKWFEVVE